MQKLFRKFLPVILFTFLFQLQAHTVATADSGKSDLTAPDGHDQMEDAGDERPEKSAKPTEEKTVKIVGELVLQPPIAGMQMASIQGKVAFLSKGLDAKKADDLTRLGLSVFVPKDSKVVLKKCKKAEVTLAAAPGNFLPNPGPIESYRPPVILSFQCND